MIFCANELPQTSDITIAFFNRWIIIDFPYTFYDESEYKNLSEDDKKMAKVSWCGSNKCWDKIKKITDGIELFGTDLKQSKGKCIICKENSNEIGYVANTY